MTEAPEFGMHQKWEIHKVRIPWKCNRLVLGGAAGWFPKLDAIR